MLLWRNGQILFDIYTTVLKYCYDDTILLYRNRGLSCETLHPCTCSSTYIRETSRKEHPIIISCQLTSCCLPSILSVHDICECVCACTPPRALPKLLEQPHLRDCSLGDPSESSTMASVSPALLRTRLRVRAQSTSTDTHRAALPFLFQLLFAVSHTRRNLEWSRAPSKHPLLGFCNSRGARYS